MAEESAMSSAESGVSGMSSVGGADPAAPVPGGAGAAQAEMITKKLANYWCIIGSIPLVMFLLVALPTIFYVKKFSEYVNADYCDTKSCKELADLIQKMGDTSDACKGFSAHVCKAKTDYFAKTAEKIFTEMSNANGQRNTVECDGAGCRPFTGTRVDEERLCFGGRDAQSYAIQEPGNGL
ncbi:uncharacterized protein LOC125758852 [Rhipicephalus sanguineus]|uniref:uncharacterized protein LOC125758852 n=1 Tax=Rhipicephalus sanguineus TaxID=34632 RepID=UPI0020C55BDC|nr:uncharacterized protein LOC125758852 [Rhipicephalus sanguineus]